MKLVKIQKSEFILAPHIFKLSIFISLFYLVVMVQVPSFRNKDVLEEKVWPRYRGKRAGKQAKERALYKRYIISTVIRTRPVSRKAKPAASSLGHTPANCYSSRRSLEIWLCLFICAGIYALECDVSSTKDRRSSSGHLQCKSGLHLHHGNMAQKPHR